MSDPWLSRQLTWLEKKITRLSDQEYIPERFSLEQLLVAASGLYQAGSALRLRLYRSGLLKSKRLPCFVISIGNIVAGGAGKTPMAIYIAELLIKIGKRPVVVSRGYKGSLGAGAGVVSDGKTIFLDALVAGDEPYMMAARKTFPVVVGRDRYAAGRLAIDQLNPDVIILDDAFAHVRLERDLNLLLLDHDRPLGNRRMLPAGRLRETPAMSKKRAQAIVLTRCPDKKWSGDQATEADSAGQEQAVGGENCLDPPNIFSQYGDIPLFKSCHIPYLLKFVHRQKESGPDLPGLDYLKDRPGLLFSGIANNKSFGNTAEELGVKVMDHLEFKDHYRYKRADIVLIQKRAREIGAEMIVTTEKDWAKLDRDIQWDTDLAVIGIKIRFEDDKGFEGFIKSRLDKSRLDKSRLDTSRLDKSRLDK